MASTSFRNCFQDAAGDCLCCSTRWIAFEDAVWKSPWCGPRICGFSRSAEVVKIFPTGALLKNAFRKPCTLELFSTGTRLGRLPVCVKTYACEEADVRNFTRSAASAGCCDCFGTVRNEPPQLPTLPGTSAMFHLPEVAGAWP